MPEQLYDLTFREFAHKIEGHNLRTENDYRQRLDAARFTASLVISSMSGTAINPSDLVRFPWEKPRQIKLMKKDRFLQFQKALKKLEHGK
jgi:hypothetical protein